MSTSDQALDPDNRAWRRFLAVANEHFETVPWVDEHGRPLLVTLMDHASGDTITLEVHDSAQDIAPAVVLAMSTDDGQLSAIGTYQGMAAARDTAAERAVSDTSIEATCSTMLHPPAHGDIPPEDWVELPEQIAGKLWAPPPEHGPVALILIDRSAARMAVVGTFPNAADAGAWPGHQHPSGKVDRLIIALD